MKACWIVILAVLLLPSKIAAQAPDTLWTKTFGGIYYDRGQFVQETGDGGYIIAGETNSYGAGGEDVWLIKTDVSGNALWTKTFGGSAHDVGYAMQKTSDGGYIITGLTASSGAGSYDVYLVRADSSGNTMWTKTFGGAAYDCGESVQETSDGGFIVTGRTQSFGAGNYDVYLIKTDGAGDTIWTKTFGGGASDQGFSVLQTGDGGYIIAGITNSYGAGSDDVWLIKTNGSGDTLWTRTLGGSSADYGYSIQQTGDGGYIIAGFTYSYGAGVADVFLIKTDSSGNTHWTKTFGGTSYDFGESVQQTSDGGYIITGRTQSYGAGNYDVYLIRTDGSGDTLWTKTFGGTANDGGFSVHATSDGGYIVTGYTYSYGAGDTDLWLIKVRILGLVSPNGGENWVGGSNYSVTWYCEKPSTVDHFRLLYSTDGGSSYPDTIANNILNTDTSYSWNAPALYSSTIRVKIQALNSSNAVIAEDASDSNFTIQTYPTAVSPNGGEIWAGASVQPITWAVVGAGFAGYQLLYSADGGTSYLDTIATGISPDSLSWDWTLPAVNSTTCRVLVQILDTDDNVISEDASDGNFTIDADPPSTVTLISPSAGAFLNTGTVTLLWNKASDNLSGVAHYVLQYALDSMFIQGLIETTTVDTSFTASLPDTVYYWHVKAVDVAGNEGALSSTWQFEVDTGIPAAPALIMPLGGVYLSDTLVTYEWSQVSRSALLGGHDQTRPAGGTREDKDMLSSPIYYVLEVDTSSSFVAPVMTDTLDTTSTVISHSEDFYYWRAKAYDTAGNQGPFSSPESFGVDTTAPVIESTTVWSDTSLIGPFEVRAKVIDSPAGVDSAILLYKRDEDPDWISSTMSPAGLPDWYVGSIDSVAYAYDTVRYYIEANDLAEPGNVATHPPGAPQTYYWFVANCTGIQEIGAQPSRFDISIRGNPVKRNAQFSFSLPAETHLKLKIYDISGRLIQGLLDASLPSGHHDIWWTPEVCSGVYFYVFESPGETIVGKVVVLR